MKHDTEMTVSERFLRACEEARKILSDHQWHSIDDVTGIARRYNCDTNAILDHLYCAEHIEGYRGRWVAMVNESTPDAPGKK